MIDYGHGVGLVRIDREDLPQLRKWRNDWKVWRWCRQHDLLHQIGHERWFERQASDPSLSMYKIVSTHSGTALGVCGLTDIDSVNRRAEFSLYIGPEHQGKGYGVGCLKTLFTHGFRNLNLNVIWGETFFGNPAGKMFEKIGMKAEGVRRKFYYRDGAYLDCVLYSVLAEEWGG